MPKDVAVIVPVYNAAIWIDACMEQLLLQRKMPDEIIFVDDASTDKTVSQCASWQNKYPDRIRIIQLCVNSGPGVARNVGISACRSSFITFIDVDDRLSPYFLSRIHDCISRKALDVAVCGIEVVSDTSSQEVLPESTLDGASLLGQKILLYSTFNKAYRARFLLDHDLRFSRCRIGEDMAFAVKLCGCLPRVGAVPAALYQYVRRPGSLTGSLTVRREIFAALDDLYSFLRRAACPPHFLSLYRRLCLLHGLYYPLRLLLRAVGSQPLATLWQEVRFYAVTTLKTLRKSYEH